MKWNIVRAGLLASIPCGVWGQISPTPPAFEVASIKLNKTAVRGGSMDFSRGGERFTMTNMPLGALIVAAWNITVRQLSGPIDFLSEKYDVAAKAEHPVSSNEMIQMIQTLLVDRFKLQLRRENREVPVYALVVAKGGMKIRASTAPECGGPPLRIPSRAGGAEQGSGHLIFRNESMPDLAWALSRTVAIGDRVVVDSTGLEGCYDFELTFGRDRTPTAAADAGDPAAQRDGPSIFSALQEQLGLKLEPQKAPVEFLVIDHVERPSAN